MSPLETCFGAAAAAYSAFRPAHPPRLFERILERVPPENPGCAMDLGAGTGLSTLPLCQWFARVIAVEPDPRMAGRLEGLHKNIVVRISTAEECVKEPDSVDLVTCGTALYWMDGPRVLEKASSWLLAAHDPSRHGVRGPRNAHPSPPAVSQTAPARRLLCLHVLWQRLPAQPCGPPCLSPGTRDPLPASTPGGMIPVDSELELVLAGKSP